MERCLTYNLVRDAAQCPKRERMISRAHGAPGVYWCRQGKCSRSARRRPAFDADRHATPCTSTPSSCRWECSATTNIRIAAMSEDLVRAKLVTSMRRPESNTTGVSIMGTELDPSAWRYFSRCCPAQHRVAPRGPGHASKSRPAPNTSIRRRRRWGSLCARPS